ncbi:MAG: hypothetical protein KDB23_21835, partial [Planctomycetales bacterium]|nr:hypothetical protein [Planctomycetales bacterium]
MDHFGRSVEVHGNLVLVGTPDDDTQAENAGQVDLFDTEGILVRSFANPNPRIGDRFGRIVSFDDNKVLIGASNVEVNGVAGVGRAYLFDLTSGSLLQTFDDPLPTAGGHFGWGAAIDGNNVLVTAYQNDSAGDNVGQAYLFDAVSGDLRQTFRDPTPTDSDEFGHFAALDGNYVIVGAPTDDSHGMNVGQAHLFDVATGILLHTFNNPSPDEEDRFGHSVWVDGENVLIGAWGANENRGIAYLYNSQGDLLQTFHDPTPTDADMFSRELVIDGDLVLIGDMRDDTFGVDVGRAHLFDATTGRLLQSFDTPTATGNGHFGRSVALDGNAVVIGAHHDNTLGPEVGQVHIFTISIPGDFNGDSHLTITDLELLTEHVLSGEHVDDFDLNDDALVDAQDREFWLHDLKNTFFGDADLNGEFNSGDLVAVFQTGKYETGSDATWAEGDSNGDGTFSSSDLVLAFQDGGYEQGPRAAVSA